MPNTWDKVIRWKFEGDKLASQKLMGKARNQLFQLKNIQAMGLSEQFMLNRHFRDGSSIFARTDVPGMDIIRIYTPPQEVVIEEIERKETYLFVGGGEDFQWVVERRNPINGDMVWRVAQFYSSTSEGYVSAVDYYDGYVYACGYRKVQDPDLGWLYYWHIEKMKKATGEIVWVKEELYMDAGGLTTYPTHIVVDSTGIYISGRFPTGSSGSSWLVEKRELEEGAIVWQTAGRAEAFNSIFNSALMVTLDNNYVYVATEHLSVVPPSPQLYYYAFRTLDKVTGESLLYQAIDSPKRLTQLTHIMHDLDVSNRDSEGPNLYAGGGNEVWKLKPTIEYWNYPFDSNIEDSGVIGADITGLYAAYNRPPDTASPWYYHGYDIHKFDSKGNLKWKTLYLGIAETGFQNRTTPYDIDVDSDHSFAYIVGYEHWQATTPWLQRWFLQKIRKSDGEIIWTLQGDYKAYSNLMTVKIVTEKKKEEG